MMIDAFKERHIIKDNPEEMLRLASSITDEKLRNLFLNDVLSLDQTLINDPKKKETLLKDYCKKARIYNKLMTEKNINYNQARAWNEVGLHAWLLRLPPEGQLPTLPDTLPKDLHMLVQSYIAPLSEEELRDLVAKLKADHVKIRSIFKKSPPSDEKITPEQETPKSSPDLKTKIGKTS